MSRARLLPLLLALVAAGCGGGGEAAGEGASEAQLWVTRDRGETVLYEETVPAGLTVMQALDRVAEIETRYGGRFVQAIDGIEGSLSRGWDWFYFVNGVAADRGAAEYRLREGEIAWWDYREWRDEAEVRVVVGAFPEPFLHGYDGNRAATRVVYTRDDLQDEAAGVARILGPHVQTRRGSRPSGPLPADNASSVIVVGAGPGFVASASSPAGPYEARMTAAVARALVEDPSRYRFRYEVRE